MKRSMMQYAVVFLLAQITVIGAAANSGGEDSVAFRKFVTKIQRAYSNAHCLGFSIKYYYANADKPDLHLDSLSGEIQMNKDQSRLRLSETEMLVTDKYAIQIDNAEKSIYLAPAKHAAQVNPVGMLDTIFAHVKGVETAIKEENGVGTLTLNLSPGQAYSQVAIQIDEKTGFLQKVVYMMNTASLIEQGAISETGNSSLYKAKGRMEILFSNYQQMKFSEDIFRQENYVSRISAGQFEPSAQYRNYHIFLASSNL